MYVEWPAWMDDAACRNGDPDLHFPEKGGSTREAKAVCASCDVREECLEYAMDENIRHGVWGGLSERERRSLTRKQQRQRRRLAHREDVA